MQSNHILNLFLRGAKTALTLALQSPDLISKVVAIDNCPIHLGLTEEFPRYLRAMEEVQDARVKSHQEGDKILSKYEEVCVTLTCCPKTRYVF